MPSNERPEWASGPEWAQWEPSESGQSVRLRIGKTIVARIYHAPPDSKGRFGFTDLDIERIGMPSPDHARHVVEKIIAESIEEGAS